ncbi:hypothetical protein [Nonomuraea sp. SBT364]|uniref:hypothetical protein n=1 Tax=Nonomuraea sp. SBT364 TaxID=1580530 RepID=UPI000B2B16CA|nr:hypothetical protein [Nonomuraea sp. SBT364]
MTLGPDSLMLAMESHLAPARLAGLDATFLMDLGEDVFAVHIAEGELTIRGRAGTM